MKNTHILTHTLIMFYTSIELFFALMSRNKDEVEKLINPKTCYHAIVIISITSKISAWGALKPFLKS